MSNQFKALVINQDGDDFKREIKTIDKSFLKHGDVTVKVLSLLIEYQSFKAIWHD